MRQCITLVAVLLFVSNAAWSQTGTTYRFQADTLEGKVWVAGENARRELEKGEDGTAAGRIEIWRDGGKQIFILNPADRTYYEDTAYRTRRGVRQVSLEPLTVRRPFRVDGVENVSVDLKLLEQRDVISGYACQRAVLTFSYSLRLGLERVSDAIPALVEGWEDFCLVDAPAAVRLPFGHGLELTSGHPQVDAGIAERLATLKGMPVARMLRVTRQIERGDVVSATSALLLSDIRQEVITADRFKIPKDYRFREPELTPPVRK